MTQTQPDFALSFVRKQFPANINSKDQRSKVLTAQALASLMTMKETGLVKVKTNTEEVLEGVLS